MPVVFDVVYLTSVRFWSLQKWDQKVNNRTIRWPNTKVMLYCLGQIWCLPLVFSDELKWKPRVVMINLIATKLSTLKLVYSEKATLFCEISTLLLSIIHTDKSKVEILQSFMAFSEYMNFNYAQLQWTFISIYFSWAENSTAKMTSTTCLICSARLTTKKKFTWDRAAIQWWYLTSHYISGFCVLLSTTVG